VKTATDGESPWPDSSPPPTDDRALQVFGERLTTGDREIPLREGGVAALGTARYEEGWLVSLEHDAGSDVYIDYDSSGRVVHVEAFQVATGSEYSWHAAGVPEDVGIPTRNRALIGRLARWPKARRENLARAIREAATAGCGGHPPTASSHRPDLLPVLDAALTNDEQEVRTQAICSLAYMKHKDAFPLLVKAFASEDRTVRYYACMGVEWLADFPALRAPAIRALEAARDRKDEASFNVRLHAASALASLRVPQGPTIFIEALRNPKANEALAAHALADMGRKEAIELMVKRLETAVPSGDWHLSQCLKQLTGADLGKDAASWRAWLEANRSQLPEQDR
jgi:HEAT repeat protein